MNKLKILLLAGDGESTNILYNAVKKKYGKVSVIKEESLSKKIFFKRRIKKLGKMKVFGQLLFLVCIAPLLKAFKKNRVSEIFSKYNMDTTQIPSSDVLEVNSINNEQVSKFIDSYKPDLILINGTRIISKKILKASEAPFINIHAGITPKYRGVHGAYWALYNNDPDLCGVSVHLVDAGIDTGGVIKQKRISPTKQDNYATYPFIQLGEGVDTLINEVIPNFIKDKEIKTIDALTKESHLWYHPGFFQYLSKLLFKGVK